MYLIFVFKTNTTAFSPYTRGECCTASYISSRIHKMPPPTSWIFSKFSVINSSTTKISKNTKFKKTKKYILMIHKTHPSNFFFVLQIFQFLFMIFLFLFNLLNGQK
uniref:Uncharacterized protein n=1 Tax=Cacopsylla melanoneura TaxID=428564 RepID=A0A8D8LMB7_9HEMI